MNKPIPEVVFRHYDPNVVFEYIETVTRDCGCVYEQYRPRLRRFTAVCEPHRTMCRSLETWEMDF